MALPFEHRQREELRRALVGPVHWALYQNNVHFKSAIDVLVDVYLPTLVEGLAADALAKKRDFDEKVHKLMYEPPSSFILGPLDVPPEGL